MPIPQPGIFAQGTRSHHFLEFDLHADAGAEAVLAALSDLRQPAVSAGGANVVVAFGPEAWRSIGRERRRGTAIVPSDRWPGQHAPRILVWPHGTGPDLLLDLARPVAAALRPVAQLVADLPAFVYRDSRDLTGFIDGTENPGRGGVRRRGCFVRTGGGGVLRVGPALAPRPRRVRCP